MIEAILAHPTELDLRRIYADWLVERGDPLGELISLGLSGADAHRLQYLEVALWERIASSLPDGVALSRQWLGFPDVISGNSAEAGEGLRTVRTLLAPGPALVQNPSLTALTRIEWVKGEHLAGCPQVDVWPLEVDLPPVRPPRLGHVALVGLEAETWAEVLRADSIHLPRWQPHPRFPVLGTGQAPVFERPPALPRIDRFQAQRRVGRGEGVDFVLGTWEGMPALVATDGDGVFDTLPATALPLGPAPWSPEIPLPDRAFGGLMSHAFVLPEGVRFLAMPAPRDGEWAVDAARPLVEASGAGWAAQVRCGRHRAQRVQGWRKIGDRFVLLDGLIDWEEHGITARLAQVFDAMGSPSLAEAVTAAMGAAAHRQPGRGSISMAAVQVFAERVQVCTVGDVRVYGDGVAMTRVDTLGQLRVDAGQPAHALRDDPATQVLTRTLNLTDAVDVSFETVVRPERLVICTQAVWQQLDDLQISEAARGTPHQAVDRLLATSMGVMDRLDAGAVVVDAGYTPVHGTA